MATLRDNIIRFKRFQRLKVTLRTDRSRLLVGLDIAQAKHMVHLRHARTRVVTPRSRSQTPPGTSPNCGRGSNRRSGRPSPSGHSAWRRSHCGSGRPVGRRDAPHHHGRPSPTTVMSRRPTTERGRRAGRQPCAPRPATSRSGPPRGRPSRNASEIRPVARPAPWWRA